MATPSGSQAGRGFAFIAKGSEQGIEIGRDGEVHASWERGGDPMHVHIGGEAAIVASGQLFL
jgi:predicted PhzF superfamily epimerase YddE/YHI9